MFISVGKDNISLLDSFHKHVRLLNFEFDRKFKTRRTLIGSMGYLSLILPSDWLLKFPVQKQVVEQVPIKLYRRKRHHYKFHQILPDTLKNSTTVTTQFNNNSR